MVVELDRLILADESPATLSNALTTQQEVTSALTAEVSSVGVSDDTIIADFFLPYNCCLEDEVPFIPPQASESVSLLDVNIQHTFPLILQTRR